MYFVEDRHFKDWIIADVKCLAAYYMQRVCLLHSREGSVQLMVDQRMA